MLFDKKKENKVDDKIKYVDSNLKKEKKTKKEKKRKKKKEKKNVLRYLSFANLSTEIHGYGYSYSFKKYILTMIASFCLLLAASLVLRLHLRYILLLGVIYIAIFPFIVLGQFSYMYEQKRFREVVDYLEQMIYSFKKQSKILTALQDVQMMCKGKVLSLVENAINSIQTNVNLKGNMYEDAFIPMEKEYGCDRLNILHTFLMQVESQGGQYQKTLSVILDDIKKWTERTYSFQKDRKTLRSNIIINLAFAIVLACGMTYLLDSLKDIYNTFESPVYQVSTFICLITLVGIFMAAQKALTGKWLRYTEDEDTKKIDKYWNKINNYNAKKEKRKSRIIALLCSPVLIYGIISKDIPIIAIGAIVMLGIATNSTRIYSSYKKRLITEIEIKFPLWLRGISLGLQTSNNIFVSIRDSIETAPYVLKDELLKLIDEIEKDPTSVMPYDRFLNQFDLPEIHSTVKMLYSLTNLGSENAEEQINSLIERNNNLIDKSERLKNENELALIGVLNFLPMIVVFINMFVNLALVLYGFTAYTTSLM